MNVDTPKAAPMLATNAQQRAAGPILRARGVSKTFLMGDTPVTVLKNVDITVNAGEFIAIEGRSGSGKSTLLHILGALEQGDSGELEFEGQKFNEGAGTATGIARRFFAPQVFVSGIVSFVAALVLLMYVFPPDEDSRITLYLIYFGISLVFAAAIATTLFFLRGSLEEQIRSRLRIKSFGFVFQFYHLLPELNVLENTMLSPMIDNSWLRFRRRKRELRDRAISILTEFGMQHRLQHRPNQLSGGERQRVAIARALMGQPKILFADEPTGNLDADTGRQIMAVLEKLHAEKGQTLIMVTHDRTLARQADRVLVLKEGRLSRAES